MLKLCHMTQDATCFFSCFAFSTFFILSILANLRSVWTEPEIVICLPFVHILCLCLFFHHFTTCLALWAAHWLFRSPHTLFLTVCLDHCRSPSDCWGHLSFHSICMLSTCSPLWDFGHWLLRTLTYVTKHDFIPRLPLLLLLWLLGWYSHHFPRFPSLV